MKQQLLVHYNNTTKRKWWQKLLRRHTQYTQLKDRSIISNIPDQQLPNNSIQTAKYHLASFFIFNLIYQFSKPSNLYFLIIGILQIIPQISVSQGKPTMFVPLTLVVIVSMVKDFAEDWKRHLSDRKQNNAQIQVLCQPGFVKRKWQSIKVGQIIKVYKDQYFPCDLLILKHSKQAKTAFIQTKNLDGQTNLKLKRVPDCLAFLKNQADTQISNLSLELSYEKPNPFLSTFNGNFKMGQKKYNLQPSNIILRGCSLKINSYAIGLCIYNGHQTKIMLNSGNSKAKRSKLQYSLNFYFKVIFLFQIIVTLICSIVYGILTAINFSNLGYVALSPNFFLDSLYTWGSWFISFSNFIPISLLVTLQIVRFGQGKLLQSDKQCQSKGKPSEVQTSSVNQQLGQIQYVLSDKTGTLTQNKMDFKCLYVCGQNFGTYQNKDSLQKNQQRSMTEQQDENFNQTGRNMNQRILNHHNFSLQASPQKIIKNVDQQLKKITQSQNRTSQVDFIQNVDFSKSQKKRLLKRLNQQLQQSSQKQKKSTRRFQKIISLKKQNSNNDDLILNFQNKQEKRQLLKQNQNGLRDNQNQKINQNSNSINQTLIHLALCHNAICQGNSYTSSSPDQIALINFAKSMGYIFKGKNDDNQLQIQVVDKYSQENNLSNGKQKKTLKYKLLHILEFSSQRKRMSIICENLNKRNESQERRDTDGDILILCKGADDIILQRVTATQFQKSQITDQLIEYGKQGLRTLALCYKTISKEEYQNWNERYQKKITQLSQDRLDKIYNLQSQIERNMILLGATAIQDKLQDNVKETIQDLKKAGIKVWMLTGDKKQTAISIGYSCGLIDKQNCEKITLDCEAQHAANLINNLQELLPYIKGQKVTIVSGDLIKKIDQVSLEKLSSLLKQSASVICCRVSPKDKQWLTSLVKKWGTTLAIGDGANDVNMINQAHIGIGVRGIEGSQATRAADYTISQFKTLKRLITFHGLNFYHRNANVCLYILYKNILVTIPILAYGPLSMQSATYIYQTWIFQFYNVFYTSLPIILFGLVDTKYNSKKCLLNYYQGQASLYFNQKILIRQLISSLILINLMVLITYFGSQLTISPHGYIIYEQWSGMLIFSVIIITINLRIFIISNQLSILQILLIIFGVLSYYVTYFLIEILLYTDIKNSLNHQVSSPFYWLFIVLFSVLLEGYQYLVVTYQNLRPLMRTKKSSQVFIQMQEPLGKPQQSQKDKKKNKDKKKKQKDLQSQQINRGFAFAEDQQRSLHFI